MIDRTESGRTAVEAAAIARLAGQSGRRSVRLVADFGREWPLWEDDPAHDVRNLCTAPDDYGLSDSLTTALREWFDYWQAHYDADATWDSSANHAHWWARGRELAAALRVELADIADVRFA